MFQHLDVLQKRFPTLAEVIGCVRDLHTLTGQQPREPFFEPHSLVSVEKGKAKLLAVGPADINAWRRHMSDGSAVRMRSLEVGTAAELEAGRMAAAMAVARAHMEVAGSAAYCCEALWDAARKGDFATLNKVILHTYFGSSMRIQVKGTPALEEYLRPEEVRPLRPGDLIKAMDAFRSAGEAPGTRCQLTYGLLSEYAHPAMRATSTFTEVVADEDEGWTIRYHEESRLDAASAEMALKILLDNMRIGHACSALLSLAAVVEADGALHLETPTASDIEAVYTKILQQDRD